MGTDKLETTIHLQWQGPYSFERVEDDLNGPTDYGVYQIYGGHPVYGTSALLYIGRAMKQKFGTRVPQEKGWLDNRDAGRVEVYIGRLSGVSTPAGAVWDRQIELAERILIYAHAPPYNAQRNLAALEPALQRVHVLNWGQHRDLLPEVSGARWTRLYDVVPGYHAFDEKEMPR